MLSSSVWLARAVFGALLASLVLTLPTRRALAQSDATCGYPAAPGSVLHEEQGVPLLFHATPLSAEARAHMKAQRERVLGRSEEGPCPRAAAYVRALAQRLLTSSKLDGFADQAPDVRLVVQCESGPPLPIARASFGNVVLVPASLLRLSASEDAVVAVLAHELAHLSLRHAERLITRMEALPAAARERAANALKRTHEREADVTGLRLLVNAGYDPGAASDHLKAVEALAQRAGFSPRPLRRSHDQVPARARSLERQARVCGYARVARRAIPASVQSELRSVAGAQAMSETPAEAARM
jgi:predicted Zn-dependent protease